MTCPYIAKNEGTIDRAIRVIAGAILYLIAGSFDGMLREAFGIISVMLILTGAVGHCLLYRLLGISTVGKKK